MYAIIVYEFQKYGNKTKVSLGVKLKTSYKRCPLKLKSPLVSNENSEVKLEPVDENSEEFLPS